MVRDRGLHEKLHILAGVTPLKSGGMARYMANECSRDHHPRCHHREDGEGERTGQEGIRSAWKQIAQLREIKGVHGIHLMAIEWEEKVSEIAEGAGLLPRPKV